MQSHLTLKHKYNKIYLSNILKGQKRELIFANIQTLRKIISIYFCTKTYLKHYIVLLQMLQRLFSLKVKLSYFRKQQNIALYAFKGILQFRHNMYLFFFMMPTVDITCRLLLLKYYFVSVFAISVPLNFNMTWQ